MYFQYIKAIHLVFIVTWFAGLFYIVRLFVYYAETDFLPSQEKEILRKQYQLMQKRLWYGITWPSAIITAIMGTLLIIQYETIPQWLWIKLGFVGVLYLYHGVCHKIFVDQQSGKNSHTSSQMRIWNEVSTILLVAIVFIVMLKNVLSLVWGIVGLGAFTIVLLGGIKIYKIFREK